MSAHSWFVKLDRVLVRFNVTVTKRQSLCQSLAAQSKRDNFWL